MYFSSENSDETKFSRGITTETGALEYLSSECAAMRPFKCVGYSGQLLQGKALFDQFYAIAQFFMRLPDARSPNYSISQSGKNTSYALQTKIKTEDCE